MFLRDRWYVIGFSADVPIGTPVACTVLGEPIALYRTASGTVAALEDRCSHRGAMLTAGGECRGELLQCPYHGIEFGPDGQCRRIPSQQHISPAMHIRSYPLAEHHGFLWIWVGDPAKKTAPPDHPWNDHPEWTAVTFHIVVEAGWQLLNDNLLDMTHAGYVHKKTIGNEDGDPHALAACTTTRDGDWVRVRRFMPNMDPPEFYKPMVDWKGRIDRWHEIDFTPSYHHFYVGGVDAGTGALEGVRDGGVQFHHLHGVTPINDHRTLYVFSLARNVPAQRFGAPGAHGEDPSCDTGGRCRPTRGATKEHRSRAQSRATSDPKRRRRGHGAALDRGNDLARSARCAS